MSGAHEAGSELAKEAAALLPKPLDFDALLQVLHRYCKGP
jgi:hypothetical protein